MPFALRLSVPDARGLLAPRRATDRCEQARHEALPEPDPSAVRDTGPRQEDSGGSDLGKRLRLFYAAGPGDVIGTFDWWSRGVDDPSNVAVTYSGQFFEICRELDARAVVISSCLREAAITEGPLTVRHLPHTNPYRGALYHVYELLYDLRLIAVALAFRADLAVIGINANNWLILTLLPRLGVEVVPSLHCVLWPKYRKPRGLRWLKLWAGRGLFGPGTRAILTLSRDISDQVRELVGDRHAPLVPFLPTYRRETFADFPEPDWDAPQFRVVFAGRVERSKGVFDLLEVARRSRYRDRGQGRVVFDVCGEGSALGELIAAAEAAGLAGTFRCHGQLDREGMRAIYASSHLIVAPTTTEFIEGFNKVAVEGVLAGRPVLTSEVCPASHYLGDALELVPPDDVAAYHEALVRLSEDFEYYERRRVACRRVQEPFYDTSRSWGAALRSILNPVLEPRPAR